MRVLAVTCALLVGACSRAAGDDPFTLTHNLRTTTSVELAVATGPAREALGPAIARLEHGGRWHVVTVEPSDSVADAPRARFVVGDADTPGVDALLEELGRIAENVDLTATLGPELGLRARDEPGFALLATFADPARPGLPVTLALAHRAVDAARVLGDLAPCAEPSWQLFIGGELSRAGLLWRAPNASPPPSIELESARVAAHGGTRVVQRARFDVRAGVPIEPPRLDTAIASWERALTRLDATLLVDGEAAGVHVEVFAHSTVDAILTLAGRGELSVLNPVRPALHALIARGIPDDDGAALAALVAREALGPARARWLERAIGVEAASTWYGQNLGRWLAHLERGGFVPPIAELVDPENQRSPHVLVPARAGLVRFLWPKLGRDGLRALWRGERELVADAELEAEFRRWLEVVRKSNDAELTDWRSRRTAVVRKRAFRRGIDLVAPPFDPRVRAKGFGSAASLLSVAAARRLGANAAAFVFPVYADGGLPSVAGGGSRALSSSASDLELFVGTLRAKELGLNVMLRPRLYASPTSSLAGWSLVASPGGWDDFFALQERVGVHYGLLGELAGAELLCFGGEIASASVTKPTPFNTWERHDLDGRAVRWQTLIERARAAFSGGLTFAAESLYEAESIQFWGQLDFIGIDVLPEVVRDGLGEEFSRERVVRSLLGMLGSCSELAELHARPVLVTEIGFPATAAGWKLAALPEGDYDGDMQARLYEAWGEALARVPPRKLPHGGAFLWSWSTDPDAGGEDDRGYTPQAKPAERALERVFEKP